MSFFESPLLTSKLSSLCEEGKPSDAEEFMIAEKVLPSSKDLRGRSPILIAAKRVARGETEWRDFVEKAAMRSRFEDEALSTALREMACVEEAEPSLMLAAASVVNETNIHTLFEASKNIKSKPNEAKLFEILSKKIEGKDPYSEQVVSTAVEMSKYMGSEALAEKLAEKAGADSVLWLIARRMLNAAEREVKKMPEDTLPLLLALRFGDAYDLYEAMQDDDEMLRAAAIFMGQKERAEKLIKEGGAEEKKELASDFAWTCDTDSQIMTSDESNAVRSFWKMIALKARSVLNEKKWARDVPIDAPEWLKNALDGNVSEEKYADLVSAETAFDLRGAFNASLLDGDSKELGGVFARRAKNLELDMDFIESQISRVWQEGALECMEGFSAVYPSAIKCLSSIIWRTPERNEKQALLFIERKIDDLIREKNDEDSAVWGEWESSRLLGWVSSKADKALKKGEHESWAFFDETASRIVSKMAANGLSLSPKTLEDISLLPITLATCSENDIYAKIKPGKIIGLSFIKEAPSWTSVASKNAIAKILNAIERDAGCELWAGDIEKVARRVAESLLTEDEEKVLWISRLISKVSYEALINETATMHLGYSQMTRELLPKLLAESAKALLWSAGGATGERAMKDAEAAGMAFATACVVAVQEKNPLELWEGFEKGSIPESVFLRQAVTGLFVNNMSDSSISERALRRALEMGGDPNETIGNKTAIEGLIKRCQKSKWKGDNVESIVKTLLSAGGVPGRADAVNGEDAFALCLTLPKSESPTALMRILLASDGNPLLGRSAAILARGEACYVSDKVREALRSKMESETPSESTLIWLAEGACSSPGYSRRQATVAEGEMHAAAKKELIRLLEKASTKDIEKAADRVEKIGVSCEILRIMSDAASEREENQGLSNILTRRLTGRGSVPKKNIREKDIEELIAGGADVSAKVVPENAKFDLLLNEGESSPCEWPGEMSMSAAALLDEAWDVRNGVSCGYFARYGLALIKAGGASDDVPEAAEFLLASRLPSGEAPTRAQWERMLDEENVRDLEYIVLNNAASSNTNKKRKRSKI